MSGAKPARAALKKAPSMKVKKGDTVVVLAGKDKGVKGKVIAAFPETSKVIVEGVGRVRKHTKMSMSRRGSQQGGIVTQEAPIHVSNVMVVDSDGTATRIGYRHDEDGNKVRTSRRGKKDIS
ncbi:MAG: 50S ribosomal protein L24 [Geodermatophilaceae bacterium]|jgi:large subunit ribosomal protein L24